MLCGEPGGGFEGFLCGHFSEHELWSQRRLVPDITAAQCEALCVEALTHQWAGQ